LRFYSQPFPPLTSPLRACNSVENEEESGWPPPTGNRRRLLQRWSPLGERLAHFHTLRVSFCGRHQPQARACLPFEGESSPSISSCRYLFHTFEQALLQAGSYPVRSDPQGIDRYCQPCSQFLPAIDLGLFLFLVILQDQFAIF